MDEVKRLPPDEENSPYSYYSTGSAPRHCPEWIWPVHRGPFADGKAGESLVLNNKTVDLHGYLAEKYEEGASTRQVI